MNIKIPPTAALLLATFSCLAHSSDLSTLEIRENEQASIKRSINDFECTHYRRRVTVQTHFDRATRTARIESVTYQGMPIADSLLQMARAETPRALPLDASLTCFDDHSDLCLFFRERADLPITWVLIRLPAK